jgi:hypothetical protein
LLVTAIVRVGVGRWKVSVTRGSSAVPDALAAARQEFGQSEDQHKRPRFLGNRRAG